MVRAKFRCDEIKDSPNGDGLKDIRLQAVTDGSEENKEFWKYTPAGHIEIQCANPAASAQFEVGKEYYIDFTSAPAA